MNCSLSPAETPEDAVTLLPKRKAMRDREVGNLTGRMTAGRWLKEVEEDGDAAEAETDNGLSGGKAKAIANYPPHTK